MFDLRFALSVSEVEVIKEHNTAAMIDSNGAQFPCTVEVFLSKTNLAILYTDYSPPF